MFEAINISTDASLDLMELIMALSGCECEEHMRYAMELEATFLRVDQTMSRYVSFLITK